MGAPGSSGMHARRLPLLILGAMALLTGLWAGLARLGAVPVAGPNPMAHGPLMVSGFLGVVISLERAVAARAAWAYAGPLLCGAGAALLLLGHSEGAVALALGSAVVVAVLAVVLWRAPAIHHVVLALAAVAWLEANVLLALGRPAFDAVGPWLVFLTGTIAAERLELTRVLPRSRAAVALFVVAMGLVLVGGVVAPWARDGGVRLFSVGAVALAAWLSRFDVARRTVKQHGLVRFIAVALLSGYGWLAIAGALGLVYGHPVAGLHYDAVLHAVFVGFVFSMIFGHAPIILPAVLGVRVPFAPRFYGHLVLLHLSLAARLSGDLLAVVELRRVGAWGNAVAILVFLGSTALAVVRRSRSQAIGVLAPR